MSTEFETTIYGQKIINIYIKENHKTSTDHNSTFTHSDIFISLASGNVFNLTNLCLRATALGFDEISSISIKPEVIPNEAQEINDSLLLNILGRRIIGFVKSKYLTLIIGILVDSNFILTMGISETMISYEVWQSEEILEVTLIDACWGSEA